MNNYNYKCPVVEACKLADKNREIGSAACIEFLEKQITIAELSEIRHDEKSGTIALSVHRDRIKEGKEAQC